MDDVKKDTRFSHIVKDPKFRRMKKKNRKVQVDDRFKSMLKGNKFSEKQSIGKRGEPLPASQTENLKRFYDLDSSESEDEEVKSKSKTTGKDKLKNKQEKQKKEKNSITADNRFSISLLSSSGLKDDQDSEDEASDDDVEDDKVIEDKKPDYARGVDVLTSSGSDSDSGVEKPDYARGGGVLESSSDDDDSESDEEKTESKFNHDWGEFDKEAPEVDEATTRLAVCNMDWDRIKVQDLLVLFNSVKPAEGFIKSVSIYPSEYGLQQMEEEERQGPKPVTDDKTSAEDNENGDYQQEQLRKYQLNRLRYYYAVVECDSPATANHIYEECDGVEYETSATKVDLRFIPEDMTFDEKPTSVASDMPEATAYKPSRFRTSAFTHSKVNLTWDETDPDRLAVTMRKFTKEDLQEMDVNDYLASSSSEEDDNLTSEVIENEDEDTKEDDETRINKYKQLLKGLKDSEDSKDTKDMDIEVTWEPGLKEETEKLVKKHQQGELTPWEQYLQKKKEKRKQKRLQKSQKDDDDSEESNDEEEDGDSDNEDDDRDKEDDRDEEDDSEDELPYGVDLNDPFFKEELDKPGYEKLKEKSKPKKKNKEKKGKGKNKEDVDEKEQAALSLLLMDEKEDSKKHFNLKTLQDADSSKMTKSKRKRLKKKMKGQKKVEDDFQMDVTDDRFKAVFENPEFNIDPSSGDYKKTKAMESLIQEKVKRRAKEMFDSEERNKNMDSKSAKKQKLESRVKVDATRGDLTSLVKSVKAKAKTMQEKKKLKKKPKGIQ